MVVRQFHWHVETINQFPAPGVRLLVSEKKPKISAHFQFPDSQDRLSDSLSHHTRAHPTCGSILVLLASCRVTRTDVHARVATPQHA